MSKTLGALFDTFDEARSAKDKLVDEGVNEDDVTVITGNGEWENEQPDYNYDTQEILNRRTLGSMAGLVSFQSIMTQPFGFVDGVIPVYATYPSRELYSALNETGIPDINRRFFTEELKHGKALVVVALKTKDELERLSSLMHASGALSVDVY